MNRNASWPVLGLSAVLLVRPIAVAAQDSPVRQAVDAVRQANLEARESQARIDDLDQRTAALLSEYREVGQRLDASREYNAQLEQLVQSQSDRIASLQEQVERAGMLGRELRPLMARMLDTLASFVDMDMPFLLPERRERIAELRSLMTRPDTSDSEKYRRLLEAYQIESEYGRTVEAFRGAVTLGGEELTVDFLRVGRVVLLFRTLDGERTGQWDPRQQRWTDSVSLSRAELSKAFRVARRQAPPDLLLLPVPAPE